MTNRQRLKEKGWIDFHLFLSPTEYQQLKSSAKIMRLSMSELTRKALRSYKINPPEKVEKIPSITKGLIKKYMGQEKY